MTTDHLAEARAILNGVGKTAEEVQAGREDVAVFRKDAPIVALVGIGHALIAIAERLGPAVLTMSVDAELDPEKIAAQFDRIQRSGRIQPDV